MDITAGERPAASALIVHHTDAEREYAYDRDSHVGTARQGPRRGARRRAGTVIDMKKDWKVIYPFEK